MPAKQETRFIPWVRRSGNGNPLQYSCLGNPIDRGAWCATVHGVTRSQIWFRTEQQQQQRDVHLNGHVNKSFHSQGNITIQIEISFKAASQSENTGLKNGTLSMEIWLKSQMGLERLKPLKGRVGRTHQPGPPASDSGRTYGPWLGFSSWFSVCMVDICSCDHEKKYLGKWQFLENCFQFQKIS